LRDTGILNGPDRVKEDQADGASCSGAAMSDDLSNAELGRRRRAIRLWLYVVAALVVVMVVVGGATRLTDSGLSIVEWRPVTGTIPPVTHADWMSEFEKYKTSSEYELVNKGMSLDEFKRIYWWEWGHRLLGRLIGVVFLLPLIVFHWRGWVEPGLRWRLWFIFALGGLQGAIGWWMVASGLVGRADVMQERLAVHLTMAGLILVAIVWTARSIVPRGPVAAAPRRLRVSGAVLVALILVQIGLGGLVAGLKAGLIYDTWPLIDGAFIPSAGKLFILAPAWTNLVDNHLTVQFVHRMAAYLLVVLTLLHALDAARCGASARGALALALFVVAQAALGIVTLLWNVPVSLALAHQFAAFLVLMVATIHAQNLQTAAFRMGRSAPPASERLRAA
jgi:cytochrome c oxidase assembly protein subunit 15